MELFENCLACTWRGDRFFCNLSEDALKEFDSLTFSNVYPQGAVLFSEGQTPRGVFLLCRGSAKLSIASDDGHTLITRVARSGEILGLTSVLSGNNYNATAETLEPSQFNFVRRDDFIHFLERNTGAATNVIRHLASECEASAEHVRALGLSHSAAEKLARLLLAWATERGKSVDGSLRLQLLSTHEDMSQMIGTSRETVTRLLKEFRNEKIIAVKGSTLTIHNPSALEALVARGPSM